MEKALRAISGIPEDMICRRNKVRSPQAVKQMRGEVMDVIIKPLRNLRAGEKICLKFV
jgi:hypothetical protein